QDCPLHLLLPCSPILPLFYQNRRERRATPVRPGFCPARPGSSFPAPYVGDSFDIRQPVEEAYPVWSQVPYEAAQRSAPPPSFPAPDQAFRRRQVQHYLSLPIRFAPIYLIPPVRPQLDPSQGFLLPSYLSNYDSFFFWSHFGQSDGS